MLMIIDIQVRLYDSTEIQLWTRTSTDPVIERCKGIVFKEPSNHQFFNSVKPFLFSLITINVIDEMLRLDSFGGVRTF